MQRSLRSLAVAVSAKQVQPATACDGTSDAWRRSSTAAGPFLLLSLPCPVLPCSCPEWTALGRRRHCCRRRSRLASMGSLSPPVPRKSLACASGQMQAERGTSSDLQPKHSKSSVPDEVDLQSGRRASVSPISGQEEPIDPRVQVRDRYAHEAGSRCCMQIALLAH